MHFWTDFAGLTENAGHEIAGPNSRHEIAGHEIARHENAGRDNARHETTRHEIAGANNTKTILSFSLVDKADCCRRTQTRDIWL